jgi:dimethylglycine dehydrogenase
MSKQAVVIGGGIAGAAISRTLARKGVGVKLLEKSNNLTAGATWHAAGLVTRFAGSAKLKKLHIQAVETLLELQANQGLNGLNVTGSLRLIEKGHKDRYLEAKRHVEMASLYDVPGLPTELISAEEVAAKHPLVDVTNIECAIFTPKDGDADPTALTNLVAGQAKEAGAQILVNKEVVDIVRHANDTFSVHVAGGEVFDADILVNAAGLWSKQLSRMMGLSFADHPAYVLEHQYAITETIPAIVEWQGGDAKKRLPVLRDLAGSAYIRQERTGLLIGPYESETCIAELDREWDLGPPSTFDMELFPDRLDRIEDNIMSGCELIPALGEVGFQSIVNGPTIWTGDSLPRCGRSKIPNYYDFNSLSYGIAHSLPLAEYLGGIILDGEQPWEMTTYCDPLRYGSWVTEGYVQDKVAETYSHNNCVAYDFENRKGGRAHVPTARHPIHTELDALGASYGFSFGGVEVPNVFLPSSVSLNEKTIIDHEWASYADAEAAHVLEKVGVSYASFSKIAVKGADAATFLDRLTTNLLPAVGRSRLTYALTPKGKINAEFTITRFAEDDFYVVGSRDMALHDVQWMRDCLRREKLENVQIQDISDEVDIIHIAGPLSHALMERLMGKPWKLGFMKVEEQNIAGAAVNILRVSFSGEHGYELHCPVNAAGDVLKAVLAAGKPLDLKPFGGYALNGLRVEKGFMVKTDLDYAHYTQGGIGFFCKEDKKDFIGKGTTPDDKDGWRNFSLFAVDTDPAYKYSVPGDAPVKNKNGDIVGFTTTSCFGAKTKQTIAFGFVTDSTVTVDDELFIEAFGGSWPAKKLDKPPLSCVTAATGPAVDTIKAPSVSDTQQPSTSPKPKAFA